MTRVDWRRQLEDLLAEQRVPGASLSIYDRGERRDFAAGVLNVRAGYPATTDSLFLIGSITKVFTGTLVMQLVEEGRLGLDAPVTELLPELRFGPGPDPRGMRLEHLLSHTCGIESDHFEDFGRGEDAIARHVESMAQFGLLFPPGERFSYSNSGFTILGRLIECTLGMPYHVALRTRLLEPLGIEHATTLAEEAILHRVAVGHFAGPDGEPVPTDVWTPSRACEPEGMLCAASGDVLALGVALLQSCNAQPRALLAPETAAAMIDRTVPIPTLVEPSHTHAGLGVMRYESERGCVFGHNGGVMGQAGCLRFNPDLDTAVALLTSGDSAGALAVYAGLLEAGLGEQLGVASGEQAIAPVGGPEAAPPLQLSGRYERLNSALVVEADGDELRASVEDSGPLLAEHGGENLLRRIPLEPVGLGLYRLAGMLDGHSNESYVVVPDSGGPPEYVYYRGRLLRRARG